MAEATDSTIETPDALPQEYKDAAAKLQAWVVTQPGLSSAKVGVSKGLRQVDFGDVKGEDLVRISIQDPALVDSVLATNTADSLRQLLNSSDGVRSQLKLLRPADDIDDVGNRVNALMKEAADAGIPIGEIDIKKSPVFSANFSQNQIRSRGTEVIESEKSTSLRLQIATNPKHPEEAKATAEKVAENIRKRLPDIKQALLKRIKDRKYMELTPEQEERFLKHEFKVDVVTQDNWTSVFIDIRSPEQVIARDKPEENKLDDVALKKTNFLANIPAEKRAKLVGRVILFEGEKLRKPSEIFLDVAGTLDLENLVGKTMFYLKKEKPELAERADAIMKENVFKPREQWNLPEKDQKPEKEPIHYAIDPDHFNTLTFILPVPLGKGSDVAKAIAALDLTPKQEVPAQANVAEIANPGAAANTLPDPIAKADTGLGAIQTPASPELLGAVNKIPDPGKSAGLGA